MNESPSSLVDFGVNAMSQNEQQEARSTKHEECREVKVGIKNGATAVSIESNGSIQRIWDPEDTVHKHSDVTKLSHFQYFFNTAAKQQTSFDFSALLHSFAWPMVMHRRTRQPFGACALLPSPQHILSLERLTLLLDTTVGLTRKNGA